jgi:hypothetical protein
MLVIKDVLTVTNHYLAIQTGTQSHCAALLAVGYLPCLGIRTGKFVAAFVEFL